MTTRAEAFAEFWECDRILGMVDKSNAAYIFAMGWLAAEREMTLRRFEDLTKAQTTLFAESIGLGDVILTPEQRNAVLDDWRNKP